MENSESFTAPLYEIESMEEKELTVRVPKEELEGLLQAILLL